SISIRRAQNECNDVSCQGPALKKNGQVCDRDGGGKTNKHKQTLDALLSISDECLASYYQSCINIRGSVWPHNYVPLLMDK
ncbi:hypothetical protein J6590_063771, partial [Homalodisca vitripennis]